MANSRPHVRGRGSDLCPPNRFGGAYQVADFDQVEHDEEYLASLEKRPTEFLPDRSRSVVTENDSPDVPFRFSINPYRGCEHGCSYCYARPSHEFLGLNAGLDFETKVLVKEEAPEQFRSFLMRDRWVPEPIAMSGVTDPYQPAERRYRLTRRCLEVAADFHQPMTLITKNALVVRDLDVLELMARESLVHVNISLTTLDADLSRNMEPRTSTPAARLRAITALFNAGVPVRALVAPVVPGLTETELPTILSAAKEAGARAAGYQMLRLPLTVAPIFMDWLERCFPARRERIEGRIRAMRDGKLNCAEFGERMRGSGELAQRIDDLFRVFAAKLSLDGDLPPLDGSRFRRPQVRGEQMRLF